MIYLDNAATTPLREEVRQAMEPYLTESFGNPSGVHRAAREARRAVDEARDELAEVLGCSPAEVVFTSGGTEADNLAVTGSALGSLARGAAKAVLCTSAVEHPAVLEPARFLGGLELPVDELGRLDLERARAVLAAVAEEVALVSVMLVNNETGVVQPLAELSELAHEACPRALVHTDAVQALRWREVASETAPADLVSYSAHKVGGPKGTGALVVRGEARQHLAPLARGGPQERRLRAGTENVAGIVGFARAARLAAEERQGTLESVAGLARRLLAGIFALCPGASLAGAGATRVPGICNVGFEGVRAEALLLLLDRAGICASGGSACASGALEPSPVLMAMGLEAGAARGHVRFSLSPANSPADVDALLAALGPALERLAS
jgi:cysteine desulfurase